MGQLAATEQGQCRSGRRRPDVALVLEIDREFRQKAQHNVLPVIELPGHPNHFRPVLCQKYREWQLTARYKASPNEVVVYCRHPRFDTVKRAQVTTGRIGRAMGKRIIRGRRNECARHYRHLSPAAPWRVPWRSVGVASLLLLGVLVVARSPIWDDRDPSVRPAVATNKAIIATTPEARSRTKGLDDTSMDEGFTVVASDDLLTARAVDLPLKNLLATQYLQRDLDAQLTLAAEEPIDDEGLGDEPPAVPYGSKERQARIQEIKQLATNTNSTNVQTLSELVTYDGDSLVRRIAVLELGKIRESGALPALQTALSDADQTVRVHAVLALGKMGGEQAVNLLGATLLQDPKPHIRRLAAIRLGRLGGDSALVALHTAQGDTDESVRWAVESALRRLESF